MKKSAVHKDEVVYSVFSETFADGLTGWRQPRAPDKEKHIFQADPLHTCEYCGSMHPEELVEAIKAGARMEFAGMKYGWPHKVYVDNIPNRFAGELEYRVCSSNPPQDEIDAGMWHKIATGKFDPDTRAPVYAWYASPTPAGKTTSGKFYTQHLQDCTPEQRGLIEMAMGMTFIFVDGRVQWSRLARA